MIRKGRVRIERGVLNTFSDLPENNQKIFLKIKNFIDEKTNQDNEINIFGSFYRGDWDEFSDYDILVKEKINGITKKDISDFVGVKVDIFINNKTTIQIPNSLI